jgi:hypothetical protein
MSKSSLDINDAQNQKEKKNGPSGGSKHRSSKEHQ